MTGREELLAKALEKIIEFDTDVSDGGKVHDHGIFAEIAIEALRHPAQQKPDCGVDPVELRNNTIELCAKLADQAAMRCVRERIPGDSVARHIAQNIRGLLEALSLSSTASATPPDEIERLRTVAWAAQGMLNADTYVSDIPREQAVREATLKLQQALGTWQMHHTAKAAANGG